jgi:RNA polymerase sigma-70 factor (ECF subfamily)
MRTASADGESDAALLDRVAQRRDARAFEALYTRHTERLYATALRITHEPDIAADVVHDAWVRAVERAGRFEHRATFRTWLTGILINCIRERRRDDAPLALAADVTDTLAAPLVVDSDADALDLDAAIAALSLGFRQVLVLHDVEGFTHDEIARMLGIATGTSKSQLARARQRVREMLASGLPRKAP